MSVTPQHASERKDTVYDLVEVPEDLGPFAVTVDDAAVKQFAFTQDDYGPWHFTDETPFGARIAHASLLANDLLQTYLTKYQTNLHEESGASWINEAHVYEQLTFHNPVRVGETVTIDGRYVDKFVRRGRGRVIMEAQARGEDGRPLVSHRGIEIMRLQSDGHEERPPEDAGRKVTGEVKEHVAPASTARIDLEPGTPLETLVKRPSRAQIAVYSTIPYLGTRPNIHTDLGVAGRAGLDELVMQGQQGACYAAELLTSFFGAAWFTSGRLEVKFIRPIFAGDRVEVSGAVVGPNDEDGERLDVDVWIRDPSGALASVGWASAKVS